MKFRFVALVAGCLLATAAFAGDRVDIETLAKQADLSARQVRMVLGAPVAFAEYRTSYALSRHKLTKLIGKAQVRELTQRYQAELENAASLARN